MKRHINQEGARLSIKRTGPQHNTLQVYRDRKTISLHGKNDPLQQTKITHPQLILTK